MNMKKNRLILIILVIALIIILIGIGFTLLNRSSSTPLPKVQNGTEAILVYGMLPELTNEEYNTKYLALKEYCRQDTWSMVKILEGLRNLIK